MKLNAKGDEQGLSNGRLCNAEALPYDVRHPIILLRGHVITRLVKIIK